MKRKLLGLLAVVCSAGCITHHHSDTGASANATSAAVKGDRSQSNADSLIVRGIIDSLASPANRQPANLPR